LARYGLMMPCIAVAQEHGIMVCAAMIVHEYR
jgi:hypothetical protein